MSILIKGIDLPKDRDFILLKVFPDGKTRIGLSTNYTEAMQIPIPHGRLIEEHYHGELKAKQAEGLFIMYRSADEDTDRFILEEEK